MLDSLVFTAYYPHTPALSETRAFFMDRMEAYEALVEEYRARTTVTKQPVTDVVMYLFGVGILVAPLIPGLSLLFTLGTLVYFIGVFLFLSLRSYRESSSFSSPIFYRVNMIGSSVPS